MKAGKSVPKAAKAKRSTSTTKAGKTTIPAADRKAVMQYRGFMIAAGQKNVTDQKAYQLLERTRKQDYEKAAKEAAAQAKEHKLKIWKSSSKHLQRSLMRLADTRDLLELMEEGDCAPFSSEAYASFARATLADAAEEIEQTLLDLGLIKYGNCGYFVPDRDVKAEAQVTA